MSCDLFNKSFPIETEPLVGTWNWERTTGGFIGETIDADSVDYKQKLVINDEAEAFLYRNDELTAAYNIRFENPEWLDKTTWIFYPKKESPVRSYVTTFKDGKLVLQNSCADCYTLFFTRK